MEIGFKAMTHGEIKVNKSLHSADIQCKDYSLNRIEKQGLLGILHGGRKWKEYYLPLQYDAVAGFLCLW